MSEKTRTDILNKKFKVNQIRNAIYFYIEHLKADLNKSKDEIVKLLKEMGYKIAMTYANYWKPEYRDALDLMREIHRTVFKTAARVRQDGTRITVISRSCPLCKYPRENLEVPGHNIILGFIEAFYEILSSDDSNLPKIVGESKGSRIFGEKKCSYDFTIV
ncbi:MAG: hypothetical protein ACTSQI_08950 [Candidatus Helarchaeota archaeon]